MAIDGIILINKRKGFTSRDVVNKACKILNTRKIGHCGTLDPFAEGLLILTVNKATKLLPYLEDDKKVYIAKLKLGKETDTLDVTGNIVDEKPIPHLEKDKIIEVLQGFLGKQQQLTPKYSARKINGKKLYEYARENIEVQDVYKEIEIYDIKLIDFSEDSIIFMANVSKGTYIRQLGSDIAKSLGTVGFLEELMRTSIMNFNLSKAIDIDDLSYDKLIDFNTCLDFMKTHKVTGEDLKKVTNGAKIIVNTDSELIAIKDYDNNLLAVYKKDGKFYSCSRKF